MFASLPYPITWLFQVFSKYEKELFLVGGCVRDAYVHRPIHDYDFTTNATPNEMIDIFSNLPCKIIPTGLKHGTVSILYKDMIMEVTTYRYDGEYENHRSPKQVIFTKHLTEDLARRDFTINAMAYHPIHGMFDPFHGQEDCKKKSIRCVGDATLRFQEDALRILRAIRFSFQLNFQIEATCLEALRKHTHLLTHISRERIREEFNKMLMSNHKDILHTLYQYNVLYSILPEIKHIYALPQESKWHQYDVFTHTDIALNHTQGYSLLEKLAIVFHDLGKAQTKSFDEEGHAHFYGHPQVSVQIAQTIMQRLAYAKKDIQTITTLIAYHDYYVTPNKRVLRKFLSHIDMDYPMAYRILRVQYADDKAKNPLLASAKIENLDACIKLLKEMETEPTLHRQSMLVNGNDMIALGFQKEEIGNVLHYLYNCILDNPQQNQEKVLVTLALEYQKKHS